MSALPIDGLQGVVLMTRDYPGQQRFYRDLLQLPLEAELANRTIFAIGGQQLVLMPSGADPEASARLGGADHGLGHFHLQVAPEHEAEVATALKEAGHAAPSEFFADVDGTLFHCEPLHELLPGATTSPIRALDALILITSQFEAQCAFYGTTLGLSEESRWDDGAFYRAGRQILGLFARGHHPEGERRIGNAQHGISHLEFQITGSDYPELQERLTAAGHQAYRDNFQDADGNLFHFNFAAT